MEPNTLKRLFAENRAEFERTYPWLTKGDEMDKDAPFYVPTTYEERDEFLTKQRLLTLEIQAKRNELAMRQKRERFEILLPAILWLTTVPGGSKKQLKGFVLVAIQEKLMTKFNLSEFGAKLAIELYKTGKSPKTAIEDYIKNI